MKKTLRFIFILSLLALLQSCATTTKKVESVHGDKPLIDTKKNGPLKKGRFWINNLS